MRERGGARRVTTALEAVLIGVVSVAVLTACAATDAPGDFASRASAHPSPRPTEREGDTDDTTSTAFSVQNAHQETLERFNAWVRAQPDVYRHGYIESVDDLEHTSVTLLWFGTDPWRNRLVAAGPRFGVTVRFQQRPQSLAAFTATQKRLSAARQQFKALGFSVSTISGIAAEPQPLTMAGTFSKGADRAAIRRLAGRIAGQPVVVTSGGAVF